MTPSATTSVTCGLPAVIVPVLSKTIVRIFSETSSALPLLMRIPFSAPRPIPTMTAVGVASPMAQGQAMIKTATALSNAILSACSGGAVKYQATNVTAAMAITAGVKYPADHVREAGNRGLGLLRLFD